MTSYQILFHPGVHEFGKPRQEDGNKKSTPGAQKKNQKKPTEGTQKNHKGESSKK